MNNTWLITSELANQRARKVLFTCVVYTNISYFHPPVFTFGRWISCNRVKACPVGLLVLGWVAKYEYPCFNDSFFPSLSKAMFGGGGGGGGVTAERSVLCNVVFHRLFLCISFCPGHGVFTLPCKL